MKLISYSQLRENTMYLVYRRRPDRNRDIRIITLARPSCVAWKPHQFYPEYAEVKVYDWTSAYYPLLPQDPKRLAVERQVELLEDASMPIPSDMALKLNMLSTTRFGDKNTFGGLSTNPVGLYEGGVYYELDDEEIGWIGVQEV